MSASSEPRVIAVVGPTAAGKSELAEALAMELSGEIVSADSMQVYRGMDLGTAKPAVPRRVPHHCIDICEPDEPYSAARYQADARLAISDIHSRGAQPIVAGGTGLYVRAALDDWRIPDGHADSHQRRRLEAELAENGPQAMHERLSRLEPEAAARIHPNDSKRVVRALEMLEAGESYARQAERFSERASAFDTTFIGLAVDRELLYARIDRRVDRMIEDGLLDEVRSLLSNGFRDALTASQAIGYKEFVPVVEAGADLGDATVAVKQATRRYAKRQLTWFRADPRIHWLDVTELSPEKTLSSALLLVSSD